MEFVEISNDKLTEITTLLKTHVPDWIKLMSDEISKDKDWKSSIGKKCTKQTIYNIANGLIDSQFRRIIFAKSAATVLNGAAQLNNKITSEIDSIIEKNKK